MLYSALILGLLGSLHCIGMCGPIAFMLPVSRDNKLRKALQVILYHVGRLAAYSLIGLIFGLIGRSLNLFGLQQQLSIWVGLAMIIIILLPSKRLRRYSFTGPITMAIARVKSSLGRALKKKSPDTFLTIGFLNGLLPCGLIYMAVFGAIATGSTAKGSLYMMIFGLGTVPLMTSAIYFSGMLTGLMRKQIQRFIPLLIVIIGVLFILRGLGLGIPYISPTPVAQQVQIESGHQNHLHWDVTCH